MVLLHFFLKKEAKFERKTLQTINKYLFTCWVIPHDFLSSTDFPNQKNPVCYQSVKQFEARSGPTFPPADNELTLKAPSKKMHLKMSSAEVVCCKKLTNITD